MSNGPLNIFARANRLELVQGIRAGAAVSPLTRQLGVSRPTIRTLVSAEVAKKVDSADVQSEAIAAPGTA